MKAIKPAIIIALLFAWGFLSPSVGSTQEGCKCKFDTTDYTASGKEHDNLLIQCKKTVRTTFNSEVAVREVEGARPFYEKALGVTFKRRCLHTTSIKFSRRTRNAAEICGVELYDRKWLNEMLKKNKIEKSTVLAADYNRERVI